MAKMLNRCPVCSGEFKISELTCDRCSTRVTSKFDTCKFCNLPSDHLSFIETFLKCEGNLSRVEKELGVSYPTVRNRLTGAITALGLADGGTGTPAGQEDDQAGAAASESPEETSVRRKDALNALARGEISADDAARVLRELT